MDARLSLDGRHVAGPTPEGFGVVNRDSGATLRLADVKATEGYEVSDDGSWLAWRGKDELNGTFGLHILSIRTGQRRWLSATGVTPSWAPRAGRLAFADNGAVVIYDPDNQTAIATIENASNPAWRSGSELSVTTAGGDLVLVDTAIPGYPRRSIISANAVRGRIRWSPDGRYAALVMTGFAAQLRCLRTLSDASAVTVLRLHDRRVQPVISNCSAVDFEYHWVNDAALCK
jgi:hypothetical protein